MTDSAPLSPQSELVAFRLPAKWIGRQVEVDYALPMAGKDGTLSFPGVKGELVEDLGGGVLLKVAIKGGYGELVIPKDRIQQVRCMSGIAAL